VRPARDVMDYRLLAHLHDHWIDFPGYPFEREFSRDEYLLRLRRARVEMASHALDALVITSSVVGRWFTSMLEPHEWHDLCQARSAWFILTYDRDLLYMTPTTAGEHFNTTRRSTWVSQIRAIVERTEGPRWELWDVAQMAGVLSELGLERGRLGFELGDCMTLGMSVHDFLRLRDLLPRAQLVDGGPAIRRLMSIHTPEEIARVRTACEAGVWIHNQVPRLLRPGMTEAKLFAALEAAFADRYHAGFSYQAAGYWDVRNPDGSANLYHAAVTDRPYRAGDLISRGHSGVSHRGYGADVDRVWYLGTPPPDARRWYRITWECNRAMAEAIRPGARCSDVYAACTRVEQHYGLPKRLTGRVGHGLRNAGGLSVHPDNHTVLEPGMILSVEPMFATKDGWFDLEDQYLVPESGHEALHALAPEELPVIPA